MRTPAQAWLDEEIRLSQVDEKLRAQGFKIPVGGRKPRIPFSEVSESSGLLVRSFVDASATASGRTVEVFAAPFAKPTRVGDQHPDGTIERYTEELVRGCFAEACADPLSVHLCVGHDGPQVGFANDLEERSDGLHSRFRLTGSRRAADRIVSRIRSGNLAACSVEFAPVDTRRTEAGVVQRVRCELHGVALVARGAYAEARVVAARSAVV